jgi:hypothetical protein
MKKLLLLCRKCHESGPEYEDTREKEEVKERENTSIKRDEKRIPSIRQYIEYNIFLHFPADRIILSPGVLSYRYLPI